MLSGTVDRHKLRAEREACGLTREQLSVLIGKSYNTITAWEKGFRQPSARTLTLIARELDCEVSDLLEGPPRKVAS